MNKKRNPFFPTIQWIESKFGLLDFFRRSGPTWRSARIWPGEPTSSSRASLMQLLSFAHQEKLELIPIVEGLACESRDRFSKHLRRLNQRLKQGTPLVAALEQTPYLISDDDVLAIRFATQTGTLEHTYLQLQSVYKTLPDVENRLRNMMTYWAVLGVTLLVVTVFLATFILPQHMAIYREFGMQPYVELNVFATIVSVFQSKVFLVSASGMLLVIGYLWFPIRQRARRIVSRYLIRPVAKPPISRVLRLLSAALSSGRPLSGAISTLAKFHYNRGLQQKLLIARNDMEQGKDVWLSLRDTGILKNSEWIAICSLPDPASQAWLLEKIAFEKEFEMRQKEWWTLSIVHLIVLLAMGGFVLFICIAFFGFNTHLVKALA